MNLTNRFHDAICDTMTQPGAHDRLQGAPFYIGQAGFLWREISEMMSQSMGINELEEDRGPRSIISTVENVRRASKRSDNRVLSRREISKQRKGGRNGGNFGRVRHYNAGEKFEDVTDLKTT